MVTICEDCGGIAQKVCLDEETIQRIIDAIEGGVGVGSPQIEGLNWLRHCDPSNGETTGWVATVLDEVAGTATDYYRDADFLPTPTPPSGTPCVDPDGELFVRCRRALVAGTGYNVHDILEESFIIDTSLPVDDPNAVRFVQWNNVTQATVLYSQINGDPPTGTLPDPSHLTSCADSIHKELVCVCMVDQVPTTLELVPYVSAFLQNVDVNGSIDVLPLGDFTDSTLQSTYTVLGTAIRCDELESQVTGVQGFTRLLEGSDTFNLTSLVTVRVLISVIAVGNPATPPTVSFDGGTTNVPLVAGEPPLEVSGFGRVIRPPLQIVTGVGDIVRVVSTRLVTT